jgi:hypothetical protein
MSSRHGHRIPFGLTLPELLLNKLDARRGLVPRTRYVEQLIEKDLSRADHGRWEGRGQGEGEQADRAGGN